MYERFGDESARISPDELAMVTCATRFAAQAKISVIACVTRCEQRLRLLEIARVPVRFNHVARCIVNANHSAM